MSPVVPGCNPDGFTVGAGMGLMLEALEMVMASTAGASQGWSSSSMGSCLHWLPSDPQQGTATTSSLGCFAVNNPFTSHLCNPWIPGVPTAGTCPSIPCRLAQPSSVTHHPPCHPTIAPSLRPQETAGHWCHFRWVLPLWGAAQHPDKPPAWCWSPHPPLAPEKPLPWAQGSSWGWQH